MEQSAVTNGTPQPAQGEQRSLPQPGEAVGVGVPEVFPKQVAGTPEQPLAGERLPAPGAAAGAQPYIVPVAPPPQVQPIASQQDASAPPATNPQLADDVDVIEKEWVDRAKQIVNATHDNPRRQEREVSQLQSDYLKKRYNKDVQASEE